MAITSSQSYWWSTTFLTRSVCFRAPGDSANHGSMSPSHDYLPKPFHVLMVWRAFQVKIVVSYNIEFSIRFSRLRWTGFSRRLMNVTLGPCLPRERSMAVGGDAVGWCFVFHAFLLTRLMKHRSKTVLVILHRLPSQRNPSSITRPPLSKTVRTSFESPRSRVSFCKQDVCVCVCVDSSFLHVNGLYYLDLKGTFSAFIIKFYFISTMRILQVKMEIFEDLGLV